LNFENVNKRTNKRATEKLFAVGYKIIRN